MYDYQEQVKAFLQEHFTTANAQTANVKMTTRSILDFLFKTFPKDCISDYELNDILNQLKFERGTFMEVDYNDKENLVSGWFLFNETMAQALLKSKQVESE
jgi:hypothetical protein